jgi:CubicO group peptidase (beta-lactamase class C family)/lysophospholipase L1-like esterase
VIDWPVEPDRTFTVHRVHSLVIALTLALVALPLHAQRFAPDPRIDRLFAQWDSTGSPGCAVGVVRDGRFVYERGYGMANLDYDVPITPHTVFYVGSVTKQFTAALAAMLALDGKLSLDADIRTYLPEMPDYAKTYGVPVTVAELIHHTSGIRDIYGLMELAGMRLEDVTPDATALALIARQKELNFKPGTEYLYSNSGYWLLGKILERVSGKPLRVLADERIFTPLGMTNTHFHDDPGHVMKNRAMSYESDGHGGFRISYLQNFDKIGAGGLYSTVEDLAKWDANYYSRLVGGDALQKLIHTRGVLANGDTLVYAFGNEVSTYRGLRTDEHGGSMMGYKAHLLRFPDQHLSVIETCNLGSINPGPIARKIAELYLGDRMTPAPSTLTTSTSATRRTAPPLVTLTAPQMNRVAGSYTSEELGATYRVFVRDGALMIHRPIERDTVLIAESPNSFRVAGAGLALHFDSTAATPPQSFTIQAGRVTNIRFSRPRVQGDWANLQRYGADDMELTSSTASAAKDRVVFFGNSITEAWAPHFAAMFPGKPYVGRGISGQTTPQLLVRFRQDVIDLKPKVVVILAGTNDIAGNTGPSTLEMIEDNLRSMTELAQQNGIRVVLSSVLPVYDYPWRPGLEPAPKIVALNAWMKRYAQSVGAVYLDYWTALADARQGMRAEYSADGVHPNEAGYRVMAPLAERAIAEAARK